MATELSPLKRPLSPWFPRGTTLLHDPGVNKGTAFTVAERDVLGLRGLLLPRVSSQGEQVARVLGNGIDRPADLVGHVRSCMYEPAYPRYA